MSDRLPALKWISLLMMCLALLGCKATPSKQGTALTRSMDILKDGLESNQQLMPMMIVPEEVQDALIPELTLQSERAQKVGEKKFDLNAKRVPARAFFLSLVDKTPYNVAIHPGVEGEISLSLRNVTVHDVLETVRSVYGYDFKDTSQSIQILPAQLQTRAFKVNYLHLDRNSNSNMKIGSSGLDSSSSSSSSDSSSDDSSDSSSDSSSSSTSAKISTKHSANFWDELKSTLTLIVGNSDGRMVAVSPMSGIVIVKAFPSELLRVESYLKDAELSLNKQVILEAKILEVELNDRYMAGIDWGIINGKMKANFIGSDTLVGSSSEVPLMPYRSSSAGTGTVDIVPDRNNLDLMPYGNTATGFGGLFSMAMNYGHLAAFIELLGAQGNVQVLSSPKISTTNNQKALIKVGTDQFFVTNASTSESTTGGTSTPTIDVEFDSFFSGIALDVTPQISDKDYITLHVHPTISSVTTSTLSVALGGNTNTFPLAKSTIRESDSIIRARNGQLVVLGGLMQDRTEELTSGVPVLKDIPFLGQAFRHTRQESKKSELVILLRPMIIEDEQWNYVLDEYHDSFKYHNRGFHAGGNVDLYGSMAEKRG